jgi:hypothetical protein
LRPVFQLNAAAIFGVLAGELTLWAQSNSISPQSPEFQLERRSNGLLSLSAVVGRRPLERRSLTTDAHTVFSLL